MNTQKLQWLWGLLFSCAAFGAPLDFCLRGSGELTVRSPNSVFVVQRAPSLPGHARFEMTLAHLKETEPNFDPQPIGEGSFHFIFDLDRKHAGVDAVARVPNGRQLNAVMKESFEHELAAYKEAVLADPEGAKHLVPILDVIPEKGGRMPFLILEKSSGKTLEDVIRSNQLGAGNSYSEPRTLLRTYRQIALGVRALHRANRVHLDLKPSNILVFEEKGNPVLKVTDFELSEPMGNFLYDVKGSPLYMSPGQFGETGSERIASAKCDLHALKLIFLELLLGKSLKSLSPNLIDIPNPSTQSVKFKVGANVLAASMNVSVDVRFSFIVDKIDKLESIDELIQAIDALDAEFTR